MNSKTLEDKKNQLLAKIPVRDQHKIIARAAISAAGGGRYVAAISDLPDTDYYEDSILRLLCSRLNVDPLNDSEKNNFFDFTETTRTNNKLIAKLLKVSYKTVQRKTELLEKKGYVKRFAIQAQNSGIAKEYVYCVTEQLLWTLIDARSIAEAVKWNKYNGPVVTKQEQAKKQDNTKYSVSQETNPKYSVVSESTHGRTESPPTVGLRVHPRVVTESTTIPYTPVRPESPEISQSETTVDNIVKNDLSNINDLTTQEPLIHEPEIEDVPKTARTGAARNPKRSGGTAARVPAFSTQFWEHFTSQYLAKLGANPPEAKGKTLYGKINRNFQQYSEDVAFGIIDMYFQSPDSRITQNHYSFEYLLKIKGVLANKVAQGDMRSAKEVKDHARLQETFDTVRRAGGTQNHPALGVQVAQKQIDIAPENDPLLR